MAGAEHESIAGSGGGSRSSGVQGQSPWSGGQGSEEPLKLKSFLSFRSANLPIFC